MKTQEEIQKRLETTRLLIQTLYNELDTIKDKEQYKQVFQEILINSGKEKTLKWVLTSND